MREISIFSALNSGLGASAMSAGTGCPGRDTSSRAVIRLEVHPAGYCDIQPDAGRISSKRAKKSRTFFVTSISHLMISDCRNSEYKGWIIFACICSGNIPGSRSCRFCLSVERLLGVVVVKRCKVRCTGDVIKPP